MLKQIQHFIKTNRLLCPTSPTLIALSGGADSVALLLILKKMGYPLIAVHCNFHLRGNESDRDELFVKSLCKAQEVSLYVKHFDTLDYASQKGVSIEMAARELRYRWFEQMRQETQSQAIAVAHHADDNAETLLLNLIRGTGIHGLKGMLPRNGYIVRPLLNIHRKDLVAFLQDLHQDYVTDSTNMQTDYKRNKIRHQILPLLRTINPAVDHTLAQTTQRLAEVEQLYDFAVATQRNAFVTTIEDGILIHIEALRKCIAPSTMFHELLYSYGFSTAEISMIYHQLDRPTGSVFSSSEYLAVLHRGILEVRKHPSKVSPLPLLENTDNVISPQCGLTLRRVPFTQLTSIPKVSYKVAIDTAHIFGQIYVRSVETGDRFQPFGMKGSKLVSDYLTDRHRSLIDKQKSLVVCDEKGILWLVNERISQRCAITAETTEVLLLTLHKDSLK